MPWSSPVRLCPAFEESSPTSFCRKENSGCLSSVDRWGEGHLLLLFSAPHFTFSDSSDPESLFLFLSYQIDDQKIIHYDNIIFISHPNDENFTNLLYNAMLSALIEEPFKKYLIKKLKFHFGIFCQTLFPIMLFQILFIKFIISAN